METKGFNVVNFVEGTRDLCRPGQRMTSEQFQNIHHSIQIVKSMISALPTSTDLCEILSTRDILDLVPE